MILGLQRFGVYYYLGVGFDHRIRPKLGGPGCSACDMSFNYPCSWENAQALVGHVQALMLMTKGPLAVSIALHHAHVLSHVPANDSL